MEIRCPACERVIVAGLDISPVGEHDLSVLWTEVRVQTFIFVPGCFAWKRRFPWGCDLFSKVIVLARCV